jgi:hypothetical protein
MGLRSVVLACGLMHAAGASAHEFWIEAEAGRAAHIIVGQMLTGDTLPFLDRIIRSAQYFGPAGNISLEGRQGDIPALTVDLTAPGLHLITVETEPAYIVFADLKEFRDYLDYEGLLPVLDEHLSRGLPDTEIAEEYLRYARTLVASGPGRAAGADAAQGLRYELVALTSPFASEDGTVELQLLWEGSPQVGAQVSVFRRPEADPNAVERELLRSDAAGKVVAEVGGPGLYLFNAVHMVSADGPGSVVWQSHWASLSFELSGGDDLQ